MYHVKQITKGVEGQPRTSEEGRWWVGAKDWALRGNVLGLGHPREISSNPVLPAQLDSLPIYEAQYKSCQQNLSKKINSSHSASLISLLPSFPERCTWCGCHEISVSKSPRSARFQAGPGQTRLDFPLLCVSSLFIFQDMSIWVWLQREIVLTSPMGVVQRVPALMSPKISLNHWLLKLEKLQKSLCPEGW